MVPKVKNVLRSPWNQVRGGYSFLSSSQLGSGFLPSGNTFEISASLRSVSWGGILMTSFSVGLNNFSFVSSAVGDLLRYPW